jgi:hypothetical protein
LKPWGAKRIWVAAANTIQVEQSENQARTFRGSSSDYLPNWRGSFESMAAEQF